MRWTLGLFTWVAPGVLKPGHFFQKRHKLKLNIICYKYYSLQLYWYERFHIWNPANWQIAAANGDLLVLFPTQFYLWSLLDKFWMTHSCFWFSVSVQPLGSSCWLDTAAAFVLEKQGKQCQSKAFSLVHLRQHGHMCIHPLHYCHLMAAVNYCVSCVHFNLIENCSSLSFESVFVSHQLWLELSSSVFLVVCTCALWINWSAAECKLPQAHLV